MATRNATSAAPAVSPKTRRGTKQATSARAKTGKITSPVQPSAPVAPIQDKENQSELFTVANVQVRPDFLNMEHGGFLMTMVLAFCSYEELPFGKVPDISPMPHQSNRAGSKLLFRIGNDELIAETASGWKFKKNDWVEVDPEWTLAFSHGDLAVAIYDARLILLELRTPEGESDPYDQVAPFELRGGTPIAREDVVIIGIVREFRRPYFGPETPESIELKATLRTLVENGRSGKGAGRCPVRSSLCPPSSCGRMAKMYRLLHTAANVVSRKSLPFRPSTDMVTSMLIIPFGELK